MKTRPLIFPAVSIMQCAILCAFLLGTSVVALASESDKPCTMQEAAQAEDEINLSLDWDGVYKLYKNFAHCDDGAIYEGYSDAISYLLSEKWSTIYQLNQLVLRDEGFERFILKHIDKLMSPEQEKKIRHNAVKHCPYHAKRLCKAITDRLKELDKAIEEEQKALEKGNEGTLKGGEVESKK